MQKEQLMALVSSHVDGDDERFRGVVLQIAAGAARSGRDQLSDALKKALEGRARRARSVKFSPEVGDFLSAHDPSLRMSDMVLSDHVRSVIDRVVLEQSKSDAIASAGLRPASRLLFCGPPGCGKTSAAEALASELGLPFVWVKLSSVASKFLGETSARLGLIFGEAEKVRAVYLLDEFDSIAGNRARETDVGETGRVTNCLLQLMSTEASRSVFVAATNMPDLLDRAVFRRFDYCATFGAPSHDMAARLISTRLPRVSAVGASAASSRAGELGLSMADVAAACESALRLAAATGSDVTDGSILWEVEARPTSRRP